MGPTMWRHVEYPGDSVGPRLQSCIQCLLNILGTSVFLDLRLFYSRKTNSPGGVSLAGLNATDWSSMVTNARTVLVTAFGN